MLLRHCLASCAALCVCAASFASELAPVAASAPVVQKKFNVFVLTQSLGFKHAVVTRPTIPAGALSTVEKALVEIGERSGVFKAECSQDATQLTPAKLKEIDALIFFTSGNLPLKPAEFAEIQSWLRGGKAFIGIHSATDTFKEFRPYVDMAGATFLRHPWNHGGTVLNLDPGHAAVKMFPAEFSWHDELCEQRDFDARKSRVLLALNMERSAPQVPHAVPLSWVREYGKGRVFYTNFGNSEAVWSDELFRRHVLGGLKWALKLEAGSAEADPEAYVKLDDKARSVVLESDKGWLVKAAKSVSADPNAIVDAAAKLSRDDKAVFIKLHELISAARSDENERSRKLRINQRPTEKDGSEVRQKRLEVLNFVRSPQANQ